MKLTALNTGKLKLDGGAMFGVVPKVLWNKVYPANENNQVSLTMRCLLIEDGDRKIIIDTGIGTKMSEKQEKIYQLQDIVHLEELLARHNLKTEDITDIILTHLHFDHCGGSVKYNKKGEAVPVFPNATYTISKPHWETATKPNKREKASFFPENFMPIQEHNQLKLVDDHYKFSDNIYFKLYDGHTTGQIIPFIKYKGKTIVYIADLIPSTANLPLAWVTAYDMQPLVALEEKEVFIKEALENDYILFFEHDLYNECCTLVQTEKGVKANESFSISEL